MHFEERKRITDKFRELEVKYPVDQWVINDIHFWPVFKVTLFLRIFAKEKRAGKQLARSTKSVLRRTVESIFRHSQAAYLTLVFPVGQIDFLFCGTSTYRANAQPGQSRLYLNRYFDPVMDFLEERRIPSLLLEYYPISRSGLYKSARVRGLKAMIPFFKLLGKWKGSIVGGKNFSGEIELMLDEVASALRIKRSIIDRLINENLKAISEWQSLFEFIFRRTRPKACFGLCYYSPAMYGMILAARKANVLSVDVQHGGQGELHLAYTFDSIPLSGYNTLPHAFWCWERESADHLAKSLAKSPHTVFIGGNPWLNYLSDQHLDFKHEGKRPMILYTMQPLMPAIDEYLVETVKITKNRFDWWFRFHPLMTDEMKEFVKEKLSSHGLDGEVEIVKAGIYPLPVLLSNSSVHISKFSGSLLEAGLMGTPSIIIDKTGLRSFGELIAEGKAVYLSEQSPKALSAIIDEITNNRHRTRDNRRPVHFKEVFNGLIFSLTEKKQRNEF